MKTIKRLAQRRSETKPRAFLISLPSFPYVLFLLFAWFASFAVDLHAQTTLSGDHVITGDLAVGTSGTTRNLGVTGTVSLNGVPFSTKSGGTWKIIGSGGTDYFSSPGYGNLFWHATAGDACINVRNINTDEHAIFGVREGMGGFVQYAHGGLTHFRIEQNGGGLGAVRASSYGVGDFESELILLNEDGSALFGGDVNIMGSASLAGGYVVGVSSLAAGEGSIAMAAQSFVVGRNNVVTGSEDSSNWVESDPLFVVGNGTGDGGDPPEVQNRNALTVLKNGDVIIPKRQGDILMGEFGNPE